MRDTESKTPNNQCSNAPSCNITKQKKTKTKSPGARKFHMPHATVRWLSLTLKPKSALEISPRPMSSRAARSSCRFGLSVAEWFHWPNVPRWRLSSIGLARAPNQPTYICIVFNFATRGCVVYHTSTTANQGHENPRKLTSDAIFASFGKVGTFKILLEALL